LYAASNAIRHDAAYGPSYTTRGLASIVKRWYNLAQNQFVSSSMKYDECGNVREVTDPRSQTTSTFYWLSSADNAYAFPLRTVNPLGHVRQATYSYKSGVVLTQTDANNKVTTALYDNRDRAVEVQKPSGGKKFIVYSDGAWCQPYSPGATTPYATITEQITASTSREQKVQLDAMGRLDEATVFDSGGDIAQENNYDAWSQVTGVDYQRQGQPDATASYKGIGGRTRGSLLRLMG
jgi:hypothetical protein